ncbi:MAG TPA: hypothetical protein VGO07_05945 [Candidatus Saccharimonadales bacterium]|jgi:hypothetical protein|nr:hypothetical protein [Candidatus Saccharimonadales bacterium]
MSVDTLPPPVQPLEEAVADQLEAQWAAQQAAEAQDAAAVSEFMEMTQPAAGEAPSDTPIGGQLESEHRAQNLYSPLEAPAFDVASTEFAPWYADSPTTEAPVEAAASNPWFTPASERAVTEVPHSASDVPANGEYPLAPDAAIIPNFVTAEGNPVEPTRPTPAPTERGTVYGTRRSPEVPEPAPVESHEDPMAAFTVGAGMPKTEADILREQNTLRGEPNKPIPARIQAESVAIKKAYAELERALKTANYVGVNNGEITRGDMAAALLEQTSPRHAAPEREKFRHRARAAIGNVAVNAVASVRATVAKKLAERRAENDIIFNMEEPEEVEVIVPGQIASHRSNRRTRPAAAPEAAPAPAIPAEAQVTRHRRTRKDKSTVRHRG